MTQQGIALGYPLDNLLNKRGVGPKDEGEGGEMPRGILLPDGHSPWTGNIVICGKAGSGKSTLALQIALAATGEPNRFCAGYISLEEGPAGVLRKAIGLAWDGGLREARHLHAVDEAASAEELQRVLESIIGPDTTADPYVWLFTLSPASLVRAREQGLLFQERYDQLERLLSAASLLNSQDPEHPRLPLLCVDSLNVFGSTRPVREEYHRLFDLFHRHGLVGVFTVEAGRDTPFDSTMADVVINLTTAEDQGYVVHYLEVEKSRYIQQTPGRHTFKILPPAEGEMD